MNGVTACYIPPVHATVVCKFGVFCGSKAEATIRALWPTKRNTKIWNHCFQTKNWKTWFKLCSWNFIPNQIYNYWIELFAVVSILWSNQLEHMMKSNQIIKPYTFIAMVINLAKRIDLAMKNSSTPSSKAKGCPVRLRVFLPFSWDRNRILTVYKHFT